MGLWLHLVLCICTGYDVIAESKSCRKLLWAVLILFLPFIGTFLYEAARKKMLSFDLRRHQAAKDQLQVAK